MDVYPSHFTNGKTANDNIDTAHKRALRILLDIHLYAGAVYEKRRQIRHQD